MGLDAIVYLNLANIVTRRSELLKTDPLTGEVYLVSDEVRPDFESEAISRRLGNISEIAGLQSEICDGDNFFPIVCGRILMNGSHSGGVIECAEIPQLALEIFQIESKPGLSKDGRTFVLNFKDLMRNASEQRNPIVFV